MSKEHEQQPSLEIPSELVEAYMQVFFSRQDCYALQQTDGSYRCVKRPLHTELVQAHLRGDLTLGTYALDANDTARWLCLDADDNPGWQQLKKLATVLLSEGIIAYLEGSRRGGHLWLFTPPTPSSQVRAFGKTLIKQHGVECVELYPKQDRLKTGPGSQVRLPLGIHRMTGRRYPFVSPEETLLAPTLKAQMRLLASPTRVPSEEIERRTAGVEDPLPSLTPRRPKQVFSGNIPLSERLKRQIGVYEFVSQYMMLDEQGRGLCPFHEDQVQSFQVNKVQNYWHCYAGCGGGSVIDFWMKWRQMHGQEGSFTATLKELAAVLL